MNKMQVSFYFNKMQV